MNVKLQEKSDAELLLMYDNLVHEFELASKAIAPHLERMALVKRELDDVRTELENRL